MDEDSNGGLVPVAHLRRIAESFGFVEKKVNPDLTIFTRPNVTPVQLTSAPLDAVIAGGEAPPNQLTELARLLPCTFECYLKTGDVCTYLPHPRQKAYRLFHFGALHSPETFTAVLSDPWSDLQFSYRFSDMLAKPSEAVPMAPPPLPALTAIERQLAVIEREISDLRVERQELKRRIKELGSASGGAGSLLGVEDIESVHEGRYDSDETGFSQKHGAGRHRSAHKKLITARVSTPERSRRRHASADQGSFANMGSRAGDHLTGGHDDELAGEGGGFTSRVSADRVRGNKGIWSMFFPDAQEDFARAWSFKPVSLVALGRGYVVVYEDGGVTWSDICPLLESKLRQQGLTPASTLSCANKGISPSAVRIRYIVLGAESSFYVKFDNGRMEWCGQDSFGDVLRKGVNDRRLLVDKVAFGQSGGWLVLWSDGSFDSEGMPQTLMDRLRRHHKSTSVSPRTTIIEARTSGIALGIKDVTVGPTGEWFIIYKDHSVQADNLPDALYKSLSQIREKAGRVRSITFGENRSWFVRYWDASK